MWLAPAANPSPLDAAAPSISYTITGISGTNGWYRGSSGGEYVVLHWAISDPAAEIASTSGCELAVRVDGPTTGTTKTCTATLIDNSQISVTTSPIKVDNEPPTGLAANAARAPDLNGWFNHAVGISWSGSDATAGIASCTSINYTGPDDASAAPTGICTDRAGNTSSTVSFPLKFDGSAPAVTATPGRAADANGWYNHAVQVSWAGTDPTSGVASCTSPVTYSTPDSASATLSGTCTDRAGNTSSAVSFPFKFDSSAPTGVSAASARAADSNGWFNHAVGISWSGSDATAGIASCTSINYTGPDDASAAPSGSCTDRAGNTNSTVSFPLKFDGSAPAVTATPGRVADANGWYNHAVQVSWAGTDPTSGVASCTSPITYSTPDSGSATLSGTCTDRAGNTSSAVSFPFKFDTTAPVATGATAARAPDQSGWYNHPVLISWNGTDSLSGIDGCTSSTYNGPDGGTATANGTCTDTAGNVSPPLTFPLKFDATPPVLTATPGRAADANGWYNHAVTIAWAGSDATSGVAACTPPLTYSGPDAASVAPSGGCSDEAGNLATLAFPLRFDATAPVVSARPDRAPDHGDWYNHPFSVHFVGQDDVSGVDSCTSTSYHGPYAKGLASTGHCSDRAGNLGSASFSINYDADAPGLSGLAVETEVGANVVHWKPSSADDVATLSRRARGGRTTTVFRGSGVTFVDKAIRPGLEYRYSVRTQDQAGNDSRKLSALALPKVVTLHHGGYVPRTSGAPVLRLPTVAGASYYHVQLFRSGARIFAAWPLRPQLGLHSSWKWAGRSYRLTPGRYRWFAWAGFGRRSAAHYKLLGSAQFVVARRF